MGRKMILVACLAIIAIGCNKNKNSVASAAEEVPTDAADASSLSSDGSKTEVAKGEMRELLLVLQRVHFGFDASILGEDARASLDEAAKKLSANEKVKLWVDGHTDERGTTEHNMALSERRAQSVVGYLSDLGVPEERLSIVSHGEEELRASGGGESAHAKNRRVEFRLMKGDIELVLEEGTLLDDAGNKLSDASTEAIEKEKSDIPADDGSSAAASEKAESKPESKTESPKAQTTS